VAIKLKLEGKTVIVIGGGQKAYQLMAGFIDKGAIIWVISRDFIGVVQRLGEAGKVALLRTEIKDAEAFVDSLNPKPYVLLAATDDSSLNLELAKAAKRYGSLVYAIDNPSLRDFALSSEV